MKNYKTTTKRIDDSNLVLHVYKKEGKKNFRKFFAMNIKTVTVKW